MFEHVPNGGGSMFKLAALLILVATVGLLPIIARKSVAARKMQAWLNSARNTQKALLWLSAALMFILFGAFTIVYEIRN